MILFHHTKNRLEDQTVNEYKQLYSIAIGIIFSRIFRIIRNAYYTKKSKNIVQNQNVIFDERQNQIKNIAFKYAYFILVIVMVFATIIYKKLNIVASTIDILVLGVVVSLMVCIIYNINNDSLIGINDNINKNIIEMIWLAIVPLLYLVISWFGKVIFTDYRIATDITLIVGVIFCFIILGLLIKKKKGFEES